MLFYYVYACLTISSEQVLQNFENQIMTEVSWIA